MSVRAYVVLLNGRVEGVVGVARGNSIHGTFFSDHSKRLQPYLQSVAVMRAVKKSLRFCDEYAGPVMSQATTVEGCKLLAKLGFAHVQEGWYIWPN